MLMAAAPSEPTALDLFRLVLELAEHRQVEHTVAMESYFAELLKNAKALAEDSSPQVTYSPEVIGLALALSQDGSLAESLSEVCSISDLSPEKAAQLRKKMETRVAS
jgi:hypothetical protein